MVTLPSLLSVSLASVSHGSLTRSLLMGSYYWAFFNHPST